MNAAHTLFARPIDRLTAMKPGDIETFPAVDYWRVNARRQRAAKKTGASYALRRKGNQVFVLRVA